LRLIHDAELPSILLGNPATMLRVFLRSGCGCHWSAIERRSVFVCGAVVRSAHAASIERCYAGGCHEHSPAISGLAAYSHGPRNVGVEQGHGIVNYALAGAVMPSSLGSSWLDCTPNVPDGDDFRGLVRRVTT